MSLHSLNEFRTATAAFGATSLGAAPVHHVASLYNGVEGRRTHVAVARPVPAPRQRNNLSRLVAWLTVPVAIDAAVA
jgi:hypothetical protein